MHSEAQTPEPDDGKRERGPLAVLSTAAIGSLSLPPIYVLSIGPATWLFLNGYIAGTIPILWRFYTPIRELRRNGIFAAFIDWYIALWG